MKPIVYRLFIETYLNAVLPYEYHRAEQVFNLLTSHDNDLKIDIKFLEYTVKLVDFYVLRVDRNDTDEINECLKLIFRFIEIGYTRDYTGVRNLYKSFTNPEMRNHNNRKFFDVSETISRIVRRNPGDGIFS